MSLPRIQNRLAFRLTGSLLLIVILAMAVMGLYTMRVLERNSVSNLQAGLVTEAKLMEEPTIVLLRGAPSRSALQKRLDTYASQLNGHVTLVGADGRVMGDSHQALDRSDGRQPMTQEGEIHAALTGSIGTARRYSEALGKEMVYAAIPLEGNGKVQGVLRVGVPAMPVTELVGSVRDAVFGGAVLSLCASLALGVFISRRVTKPLQEMQAAAHQMAEGTFNREVPAGGTGEIADLGNTLNRMSFHLREKIRALEQERSKATAILNNLAEGVIAVDARRGILFINPGARTILGFGNDPVEGRTLLEVVRNRRLAELVESVRDMGEGKHLQREVELGPPISRILNARAIPVTFESQEEGALLVLHDVTELRRLERMRTEFVANVSHELRTPLSAIQGYLETLREEAPPEPAILRRFLEVAHVHAERLGRLLDDLLQLSDIETGKIVLNTLPVHLYGLVDDVLAIFYKQAAQKELTVLNQIPSDLYVQADQDRLMQILVNLVDNAVKYTPAQGRVLVGARPVPPARVDIWVSDTGIGIPSTDLPRITERFYRVDKARSRELGGTGLGLAIVKHLVQAHGGELRIGSDLGKGTTMHFTLTAA